ncbi:hypothetical protein C0995_013430, partial [Termitomyces sp. Mi166
SEYQSVPTRPPTPDQAPLFIIAELIPTIPNTPIEPPRTMEDNARLMLTRGHHTAPKWDEEKRNVDEYEGEFTPAATHDEPEPAAHAYIYEEWKAEIFKLYPGSESKDRYT